MYLLSLCVLLFNAKTSLRTLITSYRWRLQVFNLRDSIWHWPNIYVCNYNVTIVYIYVIYEQEWVSRNENHCSGLKVNELQSGNGELRRDVETSEGSMGPNALRSYADSTSTLSIFLAISTLYQSKKLTY